MLITSGQTTPQPLSSRQKDEGREAVEEDLSHAIEGALDRRGTRGKRIEDASEADLAQAGWRQRITGHWGPKSYRFWKTS